MPGERKTSQQPSHQKTDNDEWIEQIYKALGLGRGDTSDTDQNSIDYHGFAGGALDSEQQGHFEDGEWVPDYEWDDANLRQDRLEAESFEPAGYFEDGVWIPESDIDDRSLAIFDNKSGDFERDWSQWPNTQEGKNEAVRTTAERPEQIAEAFRHQRAPVFQEAANTPGYDDVKSAPYGEAGGFIFYNQTEKSAFTKFDRIERSNTGALQPDKFHISVKQDQVENAFQAIVGLLLSADSPIDNWKVTNMDKAQEQAAEDELAHRVSVGAQFTLYLRTPDEDGPYSTDQMIKLRFFIEALEAALMTSWVDQGETPDSDISGNAWSYISYRNEEKSSRLTEGANRLQEQNTLENEAVFRALTL